MIKITETKQTSNCLIGDYFLFFVQKFLDTTVATNGMWHCFYLKNKSAVLYDIVAEMSFIIVLNLAVKKNILVEGRKGKKGGFS